MAIRAATIDLKPAVKVLFGSGSEEVIELVAARLKDIFPDLPLVVVSEFQPATGEWIPYQVGRSWRENRAALKWKLRDRQVRLCAVILEPNVPYGAIRLTGMTIAPQYLMFFNETGEHFMLRPQSIPSMFGHAAWRTKNFLRWQLHPGGWIYTQLYRLTHPSELRRPLYYRLALLRGRHPGKGPRRVDNPPLPAKPEGISVVIPSRNGRELLDRCLPRIYDADEIIVVDNGSDDGTRAFLNADFPSVIVEESREPLSFSAAVNRGIARARYSHVCLLNNDMLVEPGFLHALRRAFDEVPSLFAATAQIFFPSGQRREETGKTAMPVPKSPTDFPVRCEEPLDGEDHSYVLYGSGGCTLYDASKLALLGGFDEAYQPAYVEDLDLGVRAWQRGWPSVYCAGARVLHLHRTTTSKYFTEQDLDRALEFNYIRFLARAIEDRETFRRLWRENVTRLAWTKNTEALAFASRQEIAAYDAGPTGFFDLVRGDIAVFPGRARSGKKVVLVASPYLPFPLSHGAAVRIYNLMRRAAHDFDQVLACFVEDAVPVPKELLEICVEVVTVRRPGTHAIPSSPRPDVVEEFDSPSFHAVLRQTMLKWRPSIAQFEFTQMAQYAADCAPAKTLLVEHDITYDLYGQMLVNAEDWETRRQYDRWLAFERDAWTRVDRVVVMSEKDRAVVPGSITIANGVDLERFQPTRDLPDTRRLLFIGSFRHRPNVLAIEFFLREVFPKLHGVTLHVIAGPDHERYWDLKHPDVEVEGFVSDVRGAYRRATIVIAPLIASAGTNIKIMEAMAMGKAIVSTEAGVNGLEVDDAVVVTKSADEMAEAIAHILSSVEDRVELERQARVTAERLYDWDAIAARQTELYDGL